MEKLDAKFYGPLRKAKDMSLVPKDEWVVFLAKDNAFAYILPMYLAKCIDMGADEEQIAAVKRLMERVNLWRAAHPDRCKVPDAKGELLMDQKS